MPGRSIGRERVPRTSLKNSAMNESDNEPDSMPEICFRDDKKAICFKCFESLEKVTLGTWIVI